MANSFVMNTSNPKSDFPFSWTIENFEWTSKKLCGPSFSPIPGCGEKFCFEIEETFDSYRKRVFYVRLVNLNPKSLQICVSATTITLSNTKEVLGKTGCYITRIQPTAQLICYYPVYLPQRLSDGLQDPKLKLEGTLTFSGYDLSSSVSVDPLEIQKPSGNYECRELVKDFKAMYESGRGSDVTFTIGAKKLLAHKSILTARSPVFAKMFEHNMLENNTNNVTIEDIDYDTFNEFLLFLYTGAAGDLNCESAMSLYPVSKKYQVESLQKFCVSSLSCNLTVDHVCDALLLADLYEDEKLRKIVKIFVQKSFVDFISTAKWAELITSQPELVKKVVDFIKPVSNN